MSDAAAISLVTEQGGRWVRLDLFGGYRAVPRQRYEYGFAYPADVLLLDAWPFAALPIGFIQLAVPADVSPYVEAFGCPLFFDAKSNGFFVTEKDLSSKLPTAIPQLAELHDRMAGLALSKLESPQTTRRGQEATMRRLQEGSARRPQIASDLGLSHHIFSAGSAMKARRSPNSLTRRDASLRIAT